MNAAARLEPRVLSLLLGASSALFLMLAAWAPLLLWLDTTQARSAAISLLYVGLATEGVAFLNAVRRLRGLRYMLRALVLESQAFKPDELSLLARLPVQVTLGFLVPSVLFSLVLLVLPFQVAGIDNDTASMLFALTLLGVATVALPLYALMRSTVSRTLELVPPNRVRDVLMRLEQTGAPSSRVRVHMFAAVVTPILVVATGAALLAYAHVRYEALQARTHAAISLAQSVMDVLPGTLPTAGQKDALLVAEQAGFQVALEPQSARYAVAHNTQGQIAVSVPLQQGHAVVSLQSNSPHGAIAPVIFAAVAAFLVLAMWLGRTFGNLLANDLLLATHQVRLLNSASLLQEPVRAGPQARFRVVADLGQEIERLAERFHVFASGQERSIEARKAALRLRGLLFASVSHDLKSPLNAILGFCTLASYEPMNESQQESLGIIERRGRELLALLDTILDAARVEAQRLTLTKTLCRVEDVIHEALRRGDALGPMDAAPVEVLIDEGLPNVRWDEARVAQALAALMGHAKRLSPQGGVSIEVEAQTEIRVGQRQAAAIRMVIVDPSNTFPLEELSRLLDARYAATAPRRMGGLALGLSLARNLISMHGGSLEIERSVRGSILFYVTIPADAPDQPPSIHPLPAGRGPTATVC